MGLSFRKSIKVGKNTRVNLSKTGGIGLSTGIKGARVSINRKGVRTQAGSNGVYYRKDYSFKNGNNYDLDNSNYIDNNITVNKITIKSPQLDKLNNGIKKNKRLMIAVWIFIILGCIQPLFLILAFGVLGMIFFNKNIKRNWMFNNIVYYYKKGDSNKAKKCLDKAKALLEDDITQELDNFFKQIDNENINEVSNGFSYNIIEDDVTELDLDNEEDVQFDKQVERNLKGKEFEKQKDIESAIALYELNVKDEFEGTHPYDRLAILYRKQKNYDDEIRIINKAIKVFSALYINCESEIRKEGLKKTIDKFEYRLKRANELKNK
ncbi:DUF4236 domain-containing protein [Clostridium botulinum]|uniref:DUF4236 domain-containing protein n=1 Tax=Clostridium botulinum TaxID=1491 RepID=UPI0013F12BFD|nr:DUF4236 domain-containing protein [Clostridium botulinum]MBY6996506.1 DUF4236 domain-containing protein [Clostridium botulinum]MBY7011149.1 DUF4236 domain-containing protein [Clostridium botulinum]MCR1153619.1 DUF4236 domain-containing protein [Clostridium botulinum]MCS6165696.1 DUF4236 domain-containing protein [Clostridium botulinum]NEZ76205.1 DUF4236 domain-containing protein [Clostridium botulinum]